MSDNYHLCTEKNQGLKSFLRSLIAYESGIDPRLYDWYMDNLDRKVIKFPYVDAPGRLRRNPASGLHEYGNFTITEYFSALGVLPYFEPGNPESLRLMQYRSINPWGYVGYQIGEALLIETGYYIPQNRSGLVDGVLRELPSFYCGSVPESKWVGAKLEHVFYRPESYSWIVGTDVNCWRGTFTGKSDIFCFSDLFKPDKQDHLMIDILRSNYKKLDDLLSTAGTTIDDCLSKEWVISENNEQKRIRCTVSGLLACCHLNGVTATLELLTNSVVYSDQLGTPSLKYLYIFGGYPVRDSLRDPWLNNYEPAQE